MAHDGADLGRVELAELGPLGEVEQQVGVAGGVDGGGGVVEGREPAAAVPAACGS